MNLKTELIRRDELAKQLRYCTKTLKRLEREGLHGIKIGRRIWYRTETVRRWIEGQERSNPV